MLELRKIVFIFMAIYRAAFAFEKDMTFSVQAGQMDCFYQQVLPAQVIDIEYQVIDSTHGELDISFQLTDPLGLTIVSDFKKPENSHRHTASVNGDYRFCFDNTFSTFSHKTVFFDLMIDSEDAAEKDYDDDKEMDFGNAAESYIMRVRDISEAVTRVKDNVSTARRLQELLSAHEARDRNLAEDMCGRVLKWSIVQIIVMIVVALTQVVFVRRLFEEKNGANSFSKYLPGSLRN